MNHKAKFILIPFIFLVIGCSVTMLLPSQQIIHLSQAHLNTLEACPRKFQHFYLDHLYPLSDPQQEDSKIFGSRFHRLIQQHYIGLPIEIILSENTDLNNCISVFNQLASDIFSSGQEEIFRDSEHCRTIQIDKYVLTVIYDFLLLQPQQAKILDWKTYRKPQNRHLAKDWQTRLYLYVLAETSTYSPKDIVMTYWFINSQASPESLTFNYDDRRHQKTGNDLTHILNRLTTWLDAYQRQEPFPQVGANNKICDFCQFASLCHRVKSSPKKQLDITNIAEVSF